MIMKVKKRYWVTAAIATSLVSGALIVNACVSAKNNFFSISQKGRAMSQVLSSQTADFRFEDYETAESAQEKLLSLFPLGSSVDGFASKMSELRTECYDSQPDEEERYIACHYLENSINFVSTKWIAIAYYDNNRKIEKIEVKQGAVGP